MTLIPSFSWKNGLCVRKPFPFSENLFPENAPTMSFMFRGLFGVYHKGWEELAHQIKVRQALRRKIFIHTASQELED